MTTILNTKYRAMDASKQVNLTMTEIKEIIYQLKKSIKNMDADTSFQKADESGIKDEKKSMLEQVIKKLQS